MAAALVIGCNSMPFVYTILPYVIGYNTMPFVNTILLLYNCSNTSLPSVKMDEKMKGQMDKGERQTA